MILGAPVRSVSDPTVPVSRVSAAQVAQARTLLEDLGVRSKGRSLSLWQRMKIKKLAPGVAARMAAGLHPILSNVQALQLHKIVSG